MQGQHDISARNGSPIRSSIDTLNNNTTSSNDGPTSPFDVSFNTMSKPMDIQSTVANASFGQVEFLQFVLWTFMAVENARGEMADFAAWNNLHNDGSKAPLVLNLELKQPASQDVVRDFGIAARGPSFLECLHTTYELQETMNNPAQSQSPLYQFLLTMALYSSFPNQSDSHPGR